MRPEADSAADILPLHRAPRPLFHDTHLPPPGAWDRTGLVPTLSSAAAPDAESQFVPRPPAARAIPRSIPVAWCSLLFAGCLSMSPPGDNATFRVGGPLETTNYRPVDLPLSPAAGPTEFPAATLGKSVPEAARATPDAFPGTGLAPRPPATTEPAVAVVPPAAPPAAEPAVPAAPGPLASVPAEPEAPATPPPPDSEPRTAVVPGFGSATPEDEALFPRPELNVPDRSASAPAESPAAPAPAPRGDLSQLVLEVDGPDRRQTGAGATFPVRIRNPGSIPVEGVLVACQFDDGLRFGDSADREVRQRLGRVAAGETKELALTLSSETPGRHCARFSLRADGDESAAAASGKVVTRCVEYAARTLAVSIVGPARRTTGARGEFAFRIVNLSSAPVENVVLEVTRDSSLALRELTAGSTRSAGRIRWEAGTLGPREEVLYQAEFECRAPRERADITATLSAAGLSAEEHAATLEVVPVVGTLDVRVSDLEDPVGSGGTVRYEVRTTNLGLQPVRNLVLEATSEGPVLLEGAEAFVGDKPIETRWSTEGGRLRCDPIPELAADATLRVVLTGKGTAAGDAEVTVRVAEETPDSEVTVSEPTQVTGAAERQP